MTRDIEAEGWKPHPTLYGFYTNLTGQVATLDMIMRNQVNVKQYNPFGRELP